MKVVKQRLTDRGAFVLTIQTTDLATHAVLTDHRAAFEELADRMADQLEAQVALAMVQKGPGR